MNNRDCLALLALVVAEVGLSACAHQSTVHERAPAKAESDPCREKKPGDLCIPELPSVAPVVAGEGRIWGLFVRRGDFEIREYSATSDGVLAKGSCPSNTVAVALGALDRQPAVLCSNFDNGVVVFGRKLPNSQNFVWQAPETLTRDADESIKAISHFALLDRRLGVVYRTELRSQNSGLTSTQWRLQLAGGTAQLTSQIQTKPVALARSEVLCPRPGVTRCDLSPVTAYVADGQMHVVLASGVAGDRYLHLQQAPGKPSSAVPVSDVLLANGKPLKSPCVAASTNGNLKVFVPARTLVSTLMNSEHGERVGLIEHGTAAIAQGPDVYTSEDTQCPPEMSALSAFPNGTIAEHEAKPRWLRATRSKDRWIVGYAIPPYAVTQGGKTVTYGESFWVVRR